MKKISTVAMGRIENFKDHRLTIGLDWGDRFSHYCILNRTLASKNKTVLTRTGLLMEGVIRQRSSPRITSEWPTNHSQITPRARLKIHVA